MMEPRTPVESRPGPSGPDEFSPTGGSCCRATLVAVDICASCQRISSLTASGRSGAASPAAFAAYAAAPSACAPMWAVADACAAARAAATAAGARTSRTARSATKRRRISPAVSSSPREYARVRAMASRGRLSAGASASNTASTRSAQSAAQAATILRSASLSVCDEFTPRPSHGRRAWAPPSSTSVAHRWAQAAA
jgi:hypothetical protein